MKVKNVVQGLDLVCRMVILVKVFGDRIRNERYMLRIRRWVSAEKGAEWRAKIKIRRTQEREQAGRKEMEFRAGNRFSIKEVNGAFEVIINPQKVFYPVSCVSRDLADARKSLSRSCVRRIINDNGMIIRITTGMAICRKKASFLSRNANERHWNRCWSRASCDSLPFSGSSLTLVRAV